MPWLERIGRDRSGRRDSGDAEPESPASVRRAAPALGALFEGLSEDGGHVVLDLGHASQAHLRLYDRYARRIRFAGLLPEPPRGAALRSALRGLSPAPGDPYDVVLVWDLLDRIGPEERIELIDALVRITAPGARLYTFVSASGAATVRPIRVTPIGPDRVSHEAVGPPRPAGPPLLPAEIELLLDPFRVVRAFTIRLGYREYLAVKEETGG